MMKISSTEAFLIFAKWRDSKPPIQLSMRKVGAEMVGTPVWIISISENDESMDVEIMLNGQKKECKLDFRGATFSYGEPADSAVFPEFAEGKWASYLDVECPSGALFIFAERVIKDEAGARGESH